MMIKKLLKVIAVLSLMILFTHAHTHTRSDVAQAKTIQERRESLIEMLQQGVVQTYTYEEVDAYLTMEEAKIIATGTIESTPNYGIDGGHSTAQSLDIQTYLADYFQANTTDEQRAELYPYAVDFDELPMEIDFYSAVFKDYPEYEVVQEDGRVSIMMNQYSAMRTRLNSQQKVSGFLNNVGTKEIVVKSLEDSIRTVKVNTELRINLISPRRTDYLIYFIYNEDGGLSVLTQEPQVQRETFAELVTIDTVDQLRASWRLPEDWRMLSERRGDVPPVTWVLTSAGNGETIAIEPVFHKENVISGFINPDYTVKAYTRDVFTYEETDSVTATPDASGYFTLYLEMNLATPPIVQVINDVGQIIFQEQMDVYEYRPTALAPDSGYLTLERYFLEQNYMEGYAYPYAEITIQHLSGYAGWMLETVQADANGYFYANVPGHIYNKTTNIVSTTHPETGEKISVAPYPWTEAELADVAW